MKMKMILKVFIKTCMFILSWRMHARTLLFLILVGLFLSFDLHNVCRPKRSPIQTAHRHMEFQLDAAFIIRKELIWFWISMGETNVYTHVNKIINLFINEWEEEEEEEVFLFFFLLSSFCSRGSCVSTTMEAILFFSLYNQFHQQSTSSRREDIWVGWWSWWWFIQVDKCVFWLCWHLYQRQ